MYNVNEILDRIKKILNFKTDTELSEYLKINTTTISSWRSRNHIDLIRIFEELKNINLNWLLFDNDEMINLGWNIVKEPIEAYQNENNMIQEIKIRDDEISKLRSQIELLKDIINSNIRNPNEKVSNTNNPGNTAHHLLG
jgi:hypothetical protein